MNIKPMAYVGAIVFIMAAMMTTTNHLQRNIEARTEQPAPAASLSEFPFGRPITTIQATDGDERKRLYFNYTSKAARGCISRTAIAITSTTESKDLVIEHSQTVNDPDADGSDRRVSVAINFPSKLRPGIHEITRMTQFFCNQLKNPYSTNSQQLVTFEIVPVQNKLTNP